MTIGIFHSGYAMGPGKVVEYLIMGLNELNVNYKINQIGDINLFLQGHKLIEAENVEIPNLYLGPNIANLPIHSPILMNIEKYKKSIVPSKWVKDVHSRSIPADKIAIWNSGVDCKKWNEKKSDIEYDFLVYYKRRSKQDLDKVLDFLNSKNLRYIILEYNKYNQIQFADIISKSKWGMVVDGTETQGIAIAEMLSCNLPLLVWDVKQWNEGGPENVCIATSVPYFNSSCGEIFYEIENIEESYSKFISNVYSPREYALENLNYITQTKKLLEILEYAL